MPLAHNVVAFGAAWLRFATPGSNHVSVAKRRSRDNVGECEHHQAASPSSNSSSNSSSRERE